MPRPLARIGITPVSISDAGRKPADSASGGLLLTSCSINSYSYRRQRPSAPSAPWRLQLLLYLLDLGVAYVFAQHQVDEVLADILGVVTDAFQRSYHPHDVERPPNRARIFHHKGNVLAVDGLVLLV